MQEPSPKSDEPIDPKSNPKNGLDRVAAPAEMQKSIRNQLDMLKSIGAEQKKKKKE